MNKGIITSASFLFLTLASSQAAFTLGDLVVLQVGNGSETLANTGDQIVLDDFSTAGTLSYSLAIPQSGSTSLIQSGTASSEGALTLSANGQYLTFVGYNTAYPNATSVSGTRMANSSPP